MKGKILHVYKIAGNIVLWFASFRFLQRTRDAKHADPQYQRALPEFKMNFK